MRKTELRNTRGMAALLAVCLSVGLVLPAKALDETIGLQGPYFGNDVGTEKADGTEKVNTVTANNTEMETELVGTIQATQLKVTVPARVYFNVVINDGMDLENTTDPAIQVEQPDIKLLNHSLVPVYSWVESVDTYENGDNLSHKTEHSPTYKARLSLTTDPTELTQAKKMMLAFKKKGSVTDLSNPNQWLLAGDQTKRETKTGDPFVYPLVGTQGKIKAYSTTTKKVGELEMEIYARTQEGWHVKDEFTVIPHIVVSVLPPQYTIASVQEGEDAAAVAVDLDDEPTTADLWEDETGDPVVVTPEETIEVPEVEEETADDADTTPTQAEQTDSPTEPGPTQEEETAT